MHTRYSAIDPDVAMGGQGSTKGSTKVKCTEALRQAIKLRGYYLRKVK